MCRAGQSMLQQQEGAPHGACRFRQCRLQSRLFFVSRRLPDGGSFGRRIERSGQAVNYRTKKKLVFVFTSPPTPGAVCGTEASVIVALSGAPPATSAPAHVHV